MPPILILLAIIALTLYIVIGYLWNNRANTSTLLLAIGLIVLVLLVWVFTGHAV